MTSISDELMGAVKETFEKLQEAQTDERAAIHHHCYDEEKSTSLLGTRFRIGPMVEEQKWSKPNSHTDPQQEEDTVYY